METVDNRKRICPFCGNVLSYRHVTEDGSDWLGHHRDSYSEYDIDDRYCSCEKLPFKKMCFNCKWNDNSKCACDAVIEELKNNINSQSPFTVNDLSPEIKDVLKSCQHWTLNDLLIGNYFK